MPEIHSKSLRGGHISAAARAVLGSSRRARNSRDGNLAEMAVICAMTVGLLAGCGNKGDLYLESDVIAAEELEEAAEKLKKRKTTGGE